MISIDDGLANTVLCNISWYDVASVHLQIVRGGGPPCHGRLVFFLLVAAWRCVLCVGRRQCYLCGDIVFYNEYKIVFT